jgi:adenosylcobinamide-phosphate synthase
VSLAAVLAVALAGVLDAVFEEFPGRVHPVALLGRAVAPLDREWSAPRAVGVVIAVVVPLAVGVIAWAVVTGVGLFAGSAVGGAGPTLGVAGRVIDARSVAAGVVAGLLLFSVTSLRMLVSVAGRVIDATESDLDAARESVIALVGRDTAGLSAAQLRSAAVESAAENLADGQVAPLLGFAVGAQVSLAVGVAAACWVKTVNTLDSMLGYRSKPVGTASARLDDLVMWLPARLSALLLAVAAWSPSALLTARSWARVPPSPNSGWPMATAAVVAGVRLEKPDAYVLHPTADLPSAERARAGVRVVALAGVLAFVLAGVVVWS